MTPEQLAAFRHLLAMNRQPVHRGEQYAHPRGWNDALDFVNRALASVLGSEARPDQATDQTKAGEN